jgi:hypothetical protein
MAGAAMIRLTTGTACLTIVQNTHTRIKEPPNLGLISIICVLTGDFNHRASHDFLWAEDTKLDSNDIFRIRSGLIETRWHSTILVKDLCL